MSINDFVVDFLTFFGLFSIVGYTAFGIYALARFVESYRQLVFRVNYLWKRGPFLNPEDETEKAPGEE